MTDYEERHNLSKITCVVVGIASVFGYSSFYASADYFKQEYGDNYPHLMFYIVLLLNIFNFLGIMILLIPFSSFISISIRVYILFTIMTILFILIPLIHLLFIERFCVITIYIVASFGGYVTGTMCTTSCSFAQFLQKDIYIKCVIVGISLSSIIGCILRLIVKLFCNINQGAFIYFIISAIINLIAVTLFYINYKTKFVQYHINIYYTKTKKIKTETQNKNINGDISNEALSDSLVPAAVTIDSQDIDSNSKSFNSPLPNINVNHEYKIKYFDIICKLKYYSLSMVLVNVVTYIIYPSFIQDIPSLQFSILNNNDWIVLLYTLLWSFSDFIGRQFFSSWLPFKHKINGKILCILALLRIIFIPIIILFYKEWIKNDIALYIIIFSMAASNGYITTMTFVKYPTLLTNSNQQEIGAAIIQFAFALSLTFGSLVALLLVNAI